MSVPELYSNFFVARKTEMPYFTTSVIDFSHSRLEWILPLVDTAKGT